MIINLARRVGDSVTLEHIDSDLLFEGGAAQEGVLVTFKLDEVADEPGEETVVKIELIDQAAQDAGGEITRANLPPDDETDTKI
jgi:hypothetical protein